MSPSPDRVSNVETRDTAAPVSAQHSFFQVCPLHQIITVHRTQGPVLVLAVILGRALQSRIGQTGPRWDQAHVLYTPAHSLIGNINMEHLARSQQQATHCTGCWLLLLLRGNILEILPSLRTLACSVSLSHLKMPLKW